MVFCYGSQSRLRYTPYSKHWMLMGVPAGERVDGQVISEGTKLS